MKKFRDLPIGQKISRSILLTSISALFICSGSIIGYEFSVFQRTAMSDLFSLAEIVGANSTGAVAFGDESSAAQILSTLVDRKSIVAARIYKDGAPFATFIRSDKPDADVPQTPGDDRQLISGRHLKVFHTIRFREDKIGSIFIESDMELIYRRLWHYVEIVLIVLALMIPLVFWLSRHLQRIISNPIQNLANVAQIIATEKRYTVRAPAASNDEVGQLTETFNHMLATIEATNDQLVESNKKLVQHGEELWRSNKELEQFAYVSSHDLQEPLRKITTYAQMLEAKYKGNLDSDGEKYIEHICACAMRMRTLIQDLLAYSRTTRQEAEPAALDLNQSVKEVINDLESAIQEKQAKITFDPLPVLKINSFQAQQLFQNLIGNAIKFQGKETPVVHISCARQGEQWLFGVHDNGIGIDQKYTDLVFKVFQRLNGRNAYPGTGIGLAICKKIVEQRGGKIWVESAPGQGSHFLFTLPA